MFAVIKSDYTGEIVTGETAEFVNGVVVRGGRRWVRWEAEAVLAVDAQFIGGQFYVAEVGE